MPCSASFSISFSLSRRASGSVHLPFPTCGAFLGASHMDTITWSVGMAVSLISQSKVNGSTFLDMYIQSNLACIQLPHICALYVKAFSVGFAQHHISLMSHSCLTSLRATIADSSSSFGGSLSMASSVMLKYPRVMSGIGRCLARLSVMIFAQKSACSLLLFGAYMFSIVATQIFNHFIFSMAALPGISSCISISSGSISCLLMTKPTPAIAQGLFGWAEFSILRFFSKLLPSCLAISWSRCDS